MAKKNNILTDFESVSDNEGVTPVSNVEEKDPFFDVEDKIIKKQVSIYLDEEVIDALNKFGKENGKGAKSTLVNNFLRKYLNVGGNNND